MSALKTKRLIVAKVFATVMTLMASGGGAAQAHAGAMGNGDYVSQVVQVPGDQHSATDVTMALSDLVDVEKALKAASLKERMLVRAAFSPIAHVHVDFGPEGP